MNESKGQRRFLRFTLRSLLLLTAVVACWLGVQVNKAHKQRAAVAAIEEAGGTVFYDWQGMPLDLAAREQIAVEIRGLPRWLVRLCGRDNLQDVVHVSLGDGPVDHHLVAQLSSLPELKTLDVPAGVDTGLIKAELPSVRVMQSQPD